VREIITVKSIPGENECSMRNNRSSKKPYLREHGAMMDFHEWGVKLTSKRSLKALTFLSFYFRVLMFIFSKVFNVDDE
jgi:hypothetical protein